MDTQQKTLEDQVVHKISRKVVLSEVAITEFVVKIL